jgi:hypothetical protein
MDASIISGLAALAGAAIGGLTSAMAAWFTQRTMVQAQWVSSQALRRQDLYRDFIEVAARSYIHALQHDNPDIPGLVGLYADISRMRVVSSSEVIESAERIAQKILDTYSEPDKSFGELRGMVKDHAIDLLHDFSQACRTEQDFAISRVSKYASSLSLKHDGRGATIKT